MLGPTLFNIHINNVSKACHNFDVALFADDTEIHLVPTTLSRPSTELKRISKALTSGSLIMVFICNTKKTVTIVLTSHRAVKTARDV